MVHVLDRFHIMQRIGKAINDVRAAEVKQLRRDGYEPVLKGARWLLLKRPENFTDKQAVKFQEILQYNLKSSPQSPDEVRFPTVLGILEPHLGGQVP